MGCLTYETLHPRHPIRSFQIVFRGAPPPRPLSGDERTIRLYLIELYAQC